MGRGMLKRNKFKAGELCREVAPYVKKLPPKEIWASLRSLIDEEELLRFHRQWLAIGIYLDELYGDRRLTIQEKLTHDELKFIKVHANYYAQLGLMIAESWDQISARFESVIGASFPFEQRSQLLEQLILEECLSALTLLLAESWESPSEREAKELWDICLYHAAGKAIVGGKVRTWESLSSTEIKAIHDRFESVQEKLLGWDEEIFPAIYFWHDLCESVWTDHRQNIANFEQYLIAKSNRFKLERWKKHLWQRGKRKDYPGRGKGRGKISP